ncbi:bifunctional adenosylcobinamide kinase/adenosylcobinamide-phosphate guanylyltransferase [Shewanella glacialimarina]|uniref:bifunctional adenosylcobinamide kinase/adenosylcobinamide-phosphate guanylyltransferase n=1 Tax=Shewanella glacialimarina TaxID=2590884 RepID=UPI001CF8EF19|nr:bifunctional adenosylcobinamide kinase/adenosylcobinamide-phosphate guanylyltransferase [Shewanella glacialimarina]UCX06562.1 bifunctional adenosylcobinamide kinase/adenosylcobinamide-phosphate guanylyltransferase [Shewanella glacialimarina]
MIHLVLGGARSGKSRFAEQQVANIVKPLPQHMDIIYIATATADDDEMSIRITRHQQDRQASQLLWQTIETPLALADCLGQIDKADQVILVDCLTLYLTNHLLSLAPEQLQNGTLSSWQMEKQQLLSTLPQMQSHIILVSNEVGSGIVPMGELSREFVDQAGWLNQAVASLADKVSLVVAGLPLSLKAPKS